MDATSSSSLAFTSLIKNLDEIDPACTLPAILGKPRQSACFSVSDEKLEIDSMVSLRYFVPPPLNANVRAGLRAFLRQYGTDHSFGRPRRLDNVYM
jgi:RAT1-interacting protein